MLLAVRRKLIHQVFIIADINAAAFTLAYAKLKIGFQRYPFVPERYLIGKVGFQLIAELAGKEVRCAEFRRLRKGALFALRIVFIRDEQPCKRTYRQQYAKE